MKLLKNKKAIDYGALMVLVVAISAVYLSYNIMAKSSEFESPIGSFATGIYSIANEAEKTIFYIEESAQLTSIKATYELAKKGGFGENDCGANGEYYFLNKENPSELCERNVNENYLFYFNKELNNYLKNYEGIQLDNYDFFIDGKELNGLAKENLVLDIKLSKDNKVGKYSVKPSFKVKLEKDLSDYEKIDGIARQILRDCLSADNKEDCVKKNAQDLSFRKEGEVFLFEYNTNFKSKFEKENLKIKFALRMDSVDVPEV